MVQFALRWQLRASNISHASTSFDARNAFFSIFPACLAADINNYAHEDDKALLHQHDEEVVLTVAALDGQADFKINQGSPPGDSIASHKFRADHTFCAYSAEKRMISASPFGEIDILLDCGVSLQKSTST